LNPSFVTARSSSSAASFGSAVGRQAKPAKRSGLAVEALRGGRPVREDLHVDPRLVHLPDPQLAVVEEALGDARRAAHAVERIEGGGDFPIPVVLFERDDAGLPWSGHAVFCHRT
jgi:hypothetical protein